MSREWRVAVVGTTGLVGETMIQVLEERGFPVKELYPLASNRSLGKNVTFRGKQYPVEELASFDFSRADIGLFSAGAEISALHRLRSDEVWHYYAGSPLVVSMIDDAGALSTVTLGSDPTRGERFQGVAPAGVWFGAALAADAPPGAFALIGCTVAPGFDFADFELGTRAELRRRYPQHRRVIERLTK